MAKQMPVEIPDRVKQLAAKENMDSEDFVQETMANMAPVPPIIGDHLALNAQALGLNPGDSINYGLVDHMARQSVELELLGGVLLNPFWKVGKGGFVANYDELFLLLKDSYRKALLEAAPRLMDLRAKELHDRERQRRKELQAKASK